MTVSCSPVYRTNGLCRHCNQPRIYERPLCRPHYRQYVNFMKARRKGKAEGEFVAMPIEPPSGDTEDRYEKTYFYKCADNGCKIERSHPVGEGSQCAHERDWKLYYVLKLKKVQ